MMMMNDLNSAMYIVKRCRGSDGSARTERRVRRDEFSGVA